MWRGSWQCTIQDKIIMHRGWGVRAKANKATKRSVMTLMNNAAHAANSGNCALDVDGRKPTESSACTAFFP